jgi:hypothetical protein
MRGLQGNDMNFYAIMLVKVNMKMAMRYRGGNVLTTLALT